MSFAYSRSNIFMASNDKAVSPMKRAINYLVVVIAVIVVVGVSLSLAGITLNFDFVAQYRVRIWDGFVLTVFISILSMLGSLVIGIPVVLGKNMRFLPLRYLCDLYVKIIRGTPLIAQIYLFYYIIGTAWGVDNRIVAGVVILSVFSGAYVAEIIRGGYESLPKGPIEAARALGLSRLQCAISIQLPQMVSRILPALTGQFASVIKDSSLLSVIAVIELTQTMREISATNYNFFGCYLLLGVLYLCLTLPIMFVSRYFEKRMDYVS